jgi:hypothetical protein
VRADGDRGRRPTKGGFSKPREAIGEPLAGVLLPLRRRALGDSALRWGLLAVAGWAGAASVLLAWSKATPTNHVAAIAAGLGGLAVLIAAAAWLSHRPSVAEVARVADARLHLNERLASALFYAAATGEMESRLRSDAIQTASRRTPAEAFPLRRHRDLVAVALVTALVAVLLAVTPNPQATALARQSADREVTAQARKVVASAQQRLGQPPSPESEQLARALQAALSQLAKAGTPLASLVALSSLSRQLTQLDNASGEAAEAADAAAGEAMPTAPGEQKLASDLSKGDLKAAGGDLRSLAGQLPNLSAAERKALAAALARAAATTGGAASTGLGSSAGSGEERTFAGGLAQASAALSAGHLGSAGAALKSAAARATASAAAVSLQQELAIDQAAVQNEEAKVASQAQADAANTGNAGGANVGATGPPNSQGSAGAHRGTANRAPAAGVQGAGVQGRPSQSGTGQSGTGQSGTGQSGTGQSGTGQSGTGQGSGGGGNGGSGGGGSGSGGSGSGGSGSSGPGGGGGAGPGGNGQGGEGGPGRAKGPQAGAAHSAQSMSPSDQVFIAGQPGRSAQVVGEQVGGGGAVKTTPYQAVLPGFEKTALQGLGSHVVSPDDQGVVRNYFSSLGNGR